MQTFETFGWTQFAIHGEAKFNAMVALALDMVAKVQQWEDDTPRKTKAECESALSIALTLAKVPDTSARRILATVSGLALAFTRDYKAPLEAIKGRMQAKDDSPKVPELVQVMVQAMAHDGVENLSFLEVFARKGKAGVAGLAAEFQAKAEARAKAEAMTEAEAAEAAKDEAEAAEAAKAEASPRAKAAKQAAAILAAFAKHADNMTDAEVNAIVSALAEEQAKRLRIAAAVRAQNDIAAAAAAKAEAAKDVKAVKVKVAKAKATRAANVAKAKAATAEAAAA